MPELETVAIKSWKDASKMWRINKVDYDPGKHTLWGQDDAEAPQDAPEAKAEVQAEVQAEALEPAGDFLTDGTGSIKTVRIVDPNDRRARKEIPSAEYDPDVHKLWSERK